MTTPVFRVPALALALSLVALSACDKEKPADGEAKSDDKKADEVKADTKADAAKAGDGKQADAKTDDAKPDAAGDAPTPPPASGGSGVAYFSVNGKGIAKLDAGGWSMAIDDKRAFYNGMFADAAGNVYVVDFQAIKKLEGDKLTEVAKFDFNSFSGAGYVTANKDASKFYASSFNKYGEYEGGKWTVTEPKTIAEGLDSLTGVALAGDGTVWVSGNKALHYNKAGTWAALDLSSMGEHFYFSKLSTSPTGDVFVTDNAKLYKLSPEKIDAIEYKAEGNWANYGFALAFNSKGHALSAGMNCDLVRLDPANPGEQWTVAKKSYDCLSLQSAALDDQDRVWVSSREGLSVVGADKTATEYPSGSVLELVGNTVNDIIVVGDGPSLPAPGPAKTGSVTGKVLLEGTPVANAKLEMCASPSYGGSQPCFDSKVKFAGTTNDKGEFTFDNVPLGSYNVAVELEGKWRMNYLSQMATEMKEGASYDVGAVKFNAM